MPSGHRYERIADLIRDPYASVFVTSRLPFYQRFETVVPDRAMSPVDAADLVMDRSGVSRAASDAAIFWRRRRPDAVGSGDGPARLRNIAPKGQIERLGTVTMILKESAPSAARDAR